MKLSVILVEPENPDNIGAVARAVKNMGLRDLRLVKPPRNWKRRARKLAMNAVDTLAGARVFPSLQEAIEDRRYVVATSRRSGLRRGKFVPFPEVIEKIQNESSLTATALVFGKESKGLKNEDLRLCDALTTIPTHSDYPSMNLAQAVMVTVFSICRQGLMAQLHHPRSPLVPVPKKELEDVLEKMRGALEVLHYRREGPSVIDRILVTFHGLLKRSGLARHEANMFKGLWRRISQSKIPAWKKPGLKKIS